MKTFQLTFFLVIAASICAACSSTSTLKDAYQEHFLIGGAPAYSTLLGEDPIASKLFLTQFNQITPENLLKWEIVHPKLDTYHFEPADLFVQYGLENEQFMVGHVLVWHSQTPDWVFEDSPGVLTDRETLLTRMKSHIFEVAGRYKGKIHAWDVVNEALEDDGTIRQSKWATIIGEEFIEYAFRWAHEAAPEAKLYYNDYNMWMPAKRDGAIKIIQGLIEKDIHIDGIGMQGHWDVDIDAQLVEDSIVAFKELGLEVHITELDLNVLPKIWDNTGAEISTNFELRDELNPYTHGLPKEIEQLQADKYKELFEVMLRHDDAVERVTFWGSHDGSSWRNNWPVKGRTAYPLLFDRKGKKKAAFDAVMELTD